MATHTHTQTCVFPVKVFMKRKLRGHIHNYFGEICLFLYMISGPALSFDAHFDGCVFRDAYVQRRFLKVGHDLFGVGPLVVALQRRLQDIDSLRRSSTSFSSILGGTS